MAGTAKNEVLMRVYVVLAVLIGPIAGLLMYRTVELAIVDRDDYRQKDSPFIREIPIEAERGNIYSYNGNLLATSVPFFELYFDPYVAPPRVYYNKLDSLAYLLAHNLDNSNMTVGAWRDSLLNIRDSTSRKVSHYVKIADAVDFAALRRIQKFPIFNLGRFRGGLIPQKKSERKRPFGMLASRTVGYKRDGRKVGIEGAFDEDLAGTRGKAKMFRVDPKNDLWMPMEDLAIVESTTGKDVYTTIDVNMQDIAENALMRAMRRHQPEWGTAIIMDVETGAIRAMANLGETNDGKNYYEMFNYAIARATEPGSTFKLATMMALLEDGHITLDSEVDIEHGETEFYEETLKDDNPLSRKWDTISVRKAFEQSSNVGMAKLVDSLYEPQDWLDRLMSFHLEDDLGVSLEGDAPSRLNKPSDPQWSGISKAWMAIGYESLMTPLQMLTFYNTVANDGKMMKPYFVESVEKEGVIYKQFEPSVVNEQIASRRTIEQLQMLLEGVVERGTAKKLKTNNYRFAGKTGTSQQNYGSRRRGKKEYQASFAGYFPADNPKYSCIVVIFNPRSGAYYGGEVAGPVFREIADKAYNAMINVHEPLNRGPRPVLYASQLPQNDIGEASELATILRYVNVELDSLPTSAMGVVRPQGEQITINGVSPDEHYPNVKGMRLRDAVFILENAGYIPHPKGVGRVVKMEWHRDARGRRGKDVNLILK